MMTTISSGSPRFQNVQRNIAALMLMLGFSMVWTVSSAQVVTDSSSAVSYGHHHINTEDPAAQRRFWIEGLGGEMAALGPAGREVIRFPGVLVLMSERQPAGGTRGTIINHVGFETTDIHAAVARLQSMGYNMITRQELPSSYNVADGIGQRAGGNIIAYVQGPEDIKVELIENTDIAHDIQLHHIHWAHPGGEEIQQWYLQHFGGVAGTRIGQPAIDLPGVNLTFGPGAADVVSTRGRVLDHIGFEVDDLQALVADLKSSGITMDRDYTEIASLGIAIAFLTDPWGTYIELTEGLDKLR